MFLMEYEMWDRDYIDRRNKEKQKKSDKKLSTRSQSKKKIKKETKFSRLANKTAGMAKFNEGEMAVVKSMAANDVKTPLKQSKGKQKTIGAKKGIKYHRSM